MDSQVKISRLAQKLLDERGCIIAAFFEPPLPVIGGAWSGPLTGLDFAELPGPFFVIGTATAEEFIEQDLLYSGEWRSRSIVEMLASRAIGFFKMVPK